MSIKSCTEFLAEALPAASAAPTTPGAVAGTDAQNINAMKASYMAYTSNKPKIDAIIANKSLKDEQLQAEFDKIVANMPDRDLITFYYSTQKLLRQKVALEAQSKEVAAQIQQRTSELANMEKNAQ